MANLTERAIKDAFLKLLDEKPLNRITVKDIVEECGINRNSFYYHFPDIPSLVERIVTEGVDKIIAEHNTIDSVEEGFHCAVLLMTNRRRAVLHIYNSVNRDIFERHLMKICAYVIKSYSDNVLSGYALNERDREILINYYKCALFGISINWLENGMPGDIEADFRRLSEIKKEALGRGVPEGIIF